MEAYLRDFVNWEQNNKAKLLWIAEFAYNTQHIPFELNYDYYSRVLFEQDINPRSRSCSATNKLRELIKICYQNLVAMLRATRSS